MALGVIVVAGLPWLLSTAFAETRTFKVAGTDPPYYKPPTAEVNPGDSVAWTNIDAEAHTATGPGFDTGAIQPGETSQRRVFSTPGTYEYHCTIHPHMKGTLVVKPAQDPEFSPNAPGTQLNLGAGPSPVYAAPPSPESAAASAGPVPARRRPRPATAATRDDDGLSTLDIAVLSSLGAGWVAVGGWWVYRRVRPARSAGK